MAVHRQDPRGAGTQPRVYAQDNFMQTDMSRVTVNDDGARVGNRFRCTSCEVEFRMLRADPERHYLVLSLGRQSWGAWRSNS